MHGQLPSVLLPSWFLCNCPHPWSQKAYFPFCRFLRLVPSILLHISTLSGVWVRVTLLGQVGFMRQPPTTSAEECLRSTRELPYDTWTCPGAVLRDLTNVGCLEPVLSYVPYGDSKSHAESLLLKILCCQTIIYIFNSCFPIAFYLFWSHFVLPLKSQSHLCLNGNQAQFILVFPSLCSSLNAFCLTTFNTCPALLFFDKG